MLSRVEVLYAGKYLHEDVRTDRRGRRRKIYYFSEKYDESTVMDELPAGTRIEYSQNGLPVLKKD